MTTALPRTVRCPRGGVMADYIASDEVAVAPIRACLRLCVAFLSEHRSLRHIDDGNARCRACNAPMVLESLQHVFLECSAFEASRTAARDALRALALDLDVGIMLGVANRNLKVEQCQAAL